MKYHLTGNFWILDKEAKPFLSARTEEKEKKYIYLKRNKEFRIKKEYGRQCIGFWHNNKMNPCPKNKEINKWYQCRTCHEMDGFNICARCDGSVCNADEETKKKCLKTPHFLYITLIGNKLKVGITKSGRYLRRWIEQGSDYGCLLGTGNGKEIRQKETKIAKKITDRIYTKQKIKMFQKNNREILKKFLEKNNLKTVQIFDVRKYYKGLDNVPCIPKKTNKLSEGRIVCVKGKILVYEKEGEYYYYNLKRLKGKVVDLVIK